MAWKPSLKVEKQREKDDNDLRYTSQVMYAHLTNSKEFHCGFLRMAMQPAAYRLHPVLRNVSVLNAAYTGSDLWTL